MPQEDQMPLVDEVINRVVEAALSGRERIAACAIWRVSCEGWFKVEILHQLAHVIDKHDDMRPEEAHIDLTVRQEDEKVLIELKAFPTNYGGAGKPITSFVNGVIKDLGKLSAKRGQGEIGLAIWMAYPIPQHIPIRWARHVARVEAQAVRTRRVERIPLWDTRTANLYVMESK